MKTKLFSLLGLMVLALSASAFAAGSPVVLNSRSDKFSVSCSTISVSSETVNTFSAYNGYRQFTFETTNLALGATIFYVVDGTTGAVTVRNVGQTMLPGQGQTAVKETFEASGVVNVTLSAGQTNKNLRVVQRKLGQ